MLATYWVPLVTGWHSDVARAADMFAQRFVTRKNMTVLDVGGRVVDDGQAGWERHGARLHFERRGCRFTSLDIEAAPSVDVVSPPGEPFPFATGSFDLLVSTSTMEHDPMFWMTLREMARVVKLGGFLHLAMPSAGPHHAWPGDNWRFYRDAPAALAFWSGKPLFDSRGVASAYPLRVVQQVFSGARYWNDNIMWFERVSEPATSFTLPKPVKFGESTEPTLKERLGPVPDGWPFAGPGAVRGSEARTSQGTSEGAGGSSNSAAASGRAAGTASSVAKGRVSQHEHDHHHHHHHHL